MSLVMFGWKSVRAGIRLLLMLGCIACLLPAPLQAEPQQVKVGLYVTQLSDIDIPKQAFNAHFWAWYITPDDSYKPLDSVEVVNSKNSVTKYPPSPEKETGRGSS